MSRQMTHRINVVSGFSYWLDCHRFARIRTYNFLDYNYCQFPGRQPPPYFCGGTLSRGWLCIFVLMSEVPANVRSSSN